LRFSAVYRVGGSKSLPLFIPETGGGLRVEKYRFKGCGDIFRRIKWNNRGCKSTVWRCVSRVEKDGPDCPARTELGMEIRRLRDEKQTLQNEQASRQDLKTRIDEMMRFLNDLPCELTEYEEDYVRTLLEKITVYDDHFIIEFKSGIEIQIDE
jgi:FtsZ-binding cell division protein ZapB